MVIAVKLKSDSKATYQLFVKQHESRGMDNDPAKPPERTVLVHNVPPFVCKAGLERVFGACGRVKDVFLHQNPTSKVLSEQPVDSFSARAAPSGYKVAYVVYNKVQSLENALDSTFEHKTAFYGDEEGPLTGTKKWCKEYGTEYLDPDKLQAEVNSYMEEYDAKQKQERQREVAKDGVADGDGWITVTRHSKNKGVARTEANEKRTMASETRKRKHKELTNFYAFQQRQSKRDDIARLRKQFEQDKSRIEQMKAARKFKPF